MQPSPSEWDVVRTAAAAVVAQQTALFEQELRLKGRAAALAEQEIQLHGRLEEKRRQLDELQNQLGSAREQHRQERARAEELRDEADALHRKATTEREQVRSLRAKFIKRMKSHWSAARKDVADKQAELDRIRRLVDDEAARLRRERIEFEKLRQDLQPSRDRLRAEAERLAEERDNLARERQESQANLDLRERSIAQEKQALVEERQRLEVELQELENRRAALKDESGIIGPSEHRVHLAKLCDRLTSAEHRWQAAQVEAIDEMESLATELADREDLLRDEERELRSLAERHRQERQTLVRLRDGVERDSAELMLRQWAWQAERNHVRANLDERSRIVQSREDAIPALFEKWRQRRKTEIEELRRLVQEAVAERRQAVEQAGQLQQQAAALHDERQAVAEQALALEEARLEFLKDAERPRVAAKRLESLRRRWAGRSEAEKRERESIREHLDEEAARLRQAEAELGRQKEDLLCRERDLADRSNQLDNEQRKAEAVAKAFDAARRSWGEQRRQYDLILVDMRAEIDRLSRMIGGGESAPPLRAAA
jgi:plectin